MDWWKKDRMFPPDFSGMEAKTIEQFVEASIGKKKMVGRHDPVQMIAMRMRWLDGQTIPFNFIQAYVTDEVAAVFIVDTHDKAVTIEDDPSLFPSDELIGKLRLMIG